MSNEITQLQDYIKEQQKDIDDLAALNRLAKNRDFKRIIDKGLFETKSVQLVMLKADVSQQSEVDQKAIMQGIDAIGYLRQYFGNITATGQLAENNKFIAEQHINEIMSESEESESNEYEDVVDTAGNYTAD